MPRYNYMNLMLSVSIPTVSHWTKVLERFINASVVCQCTTNLFKKCEWCERNVQQDHNPYPTLPTLSSILAEPSGSVHQEGVNVSCVDIIHPGSRHTCRPLPSPSITLPPPKQCKGCLWKIGHVARLRT